MTTSLDAYRSDREQLLARVRELEAEVEKLSNNEDGIKPIRHLTRCPSCGTKMKNNTPVPHEDAHYNGWTYPKVCRGLWRWFRFHCWRKGYHVHQRCTACGARWVVDAEGWRFD